MKMRKFLLICSISLLFLAACDDEETAGEVTNDDIEQEEVETEDQTSDQSTEDEEKDTEQENVEKEIANNNTSASNENKPTLQQKENVKDMATNIVWAQMDHDYSYLKSVLDDNVTLDETSNTIKFNTKEASHTFDFLTGVEKDDLEVRFVDGEETDRAIVGLAAIDYENEYSYVIEMIFNDIDGKWKLVSMDINK